MIIVHAFESPPASYAKSIFLAGPTPRDAETPSWRPEALTFLEASGYDGVVFVPEAASGTWRDNYDGQCDWETECLNLADDIVFWVPRDLDSMPAFTTNAEFGLWLASGKLTLGYPPEAPKNTYLGYHGKHAGVGPYSTLHETLIRSMRKLGEGAVRTGGERQVPLHVWKTRQFQHWYADLKTAGNRLDGARVDYVKRSPRNRDHIFLVALHANVYVAKENRNKTNEIVLLRPDVSSVLMYARPRPECRLEEIEVALVREFRSTVSNSAGFVYEIPSGSSPDVALADTAVAAEEVHEETGLVVAPERFRRIGTRQIAATFSSHKAALFTVELTVEEMDCLRADERTPHGTYVEGDPDLSERTYVEVHTMGDILSHRVPVDWPTIGMICQGLRQLL